ncbi:DUF2087 domain-containing protein [Streptomyces cyaneofuscatus]|uniref:DUF2087 domain-containing protein n=1 Tax=Streptomyces cyaneofuscatus TaxID=66883 RepID=UPI003815C14A
MTAQNIVGTLADSVRLRVFSAIVLGATTPPDAARAAGTTPKETAAAVRRLLAGGLVTEDGGALHADLAHVKAAARRGPDTEAPGPGAGPDASLLRTFVVEGRLRSLPGQLERRRVVLGHLARASFEPGRTYDEPAVNDLLRAWCEGAGTDHVAVRRYLIELQILDRGEGSYWLRDDTAQRA